MQEQVASSIASGGDHILYSGGVTSMSSYISHVSGMATLSRRVRMTHNHESKGLYYILSQSVQKTNTVFCN